MSPANSAATVEVPAGTHRTGDGFEVAAVVAVPLALHEGQIDRAAFDAAVGPGKTVAGSVGRLADLLQPDAERAAAGWFASRQDASAEATIAAADALAGDVLAALRVPLFKMGLMLAGEATATLSAPDVERRHAEQAAVDAAAAAEHRAGAMLLAFEEIRRKQPDVPPGVLLMALPAADREPTLRLLLSAEAERDQSRLIAAAGTELYELDSGALRLAADVDALGPVRSLRVGEVGAGGGAVGGVAPPLLCGCRDGVTVVDADEAIDPWALTSALPGDSARGFASVACAADVIWAGHGERGVEAWRDRERLGGLDERQLRNAVLDAFVDLAPTSGVEAVPPNGPARPTAIAALSDGTALLAASISDLEATAAAGSALFVARASEGGLNLSPRAVFEDAVVVALAADLAVLDDGRIERLTADSAQSAGRLPLGVTTAAFVPWLGGHRIVACLVDGRLCMAGPDDDVMLELGGEHAGFAALAASAGRVAAVTEDRQRIAVWSLADLARPVRDVYALGTTRSRVADVAFVTASS